MTVMIFIHLILVFRNSVFFPSLTIQSFFPFTVARHQWQFIKWTQAQYRVWRIDYCWTEVVLSWLGRSIGRLAIRFARWLSGCAQFTAFVLWRLWTCGLFNHSIVFALCCALRAKKKRIYANVEISIVSIEERANKLPYDMISHSKLITCEDLFPDAYPTPYIPILNFFLWCKQMS